MAWLLLIDVVIGGVGPLVFVVPVGVVVFVPSAYVIDVVVVAVGVAVAVASAVAFTPAVAVALVLVIVYFRFGVL